MEITKKEIAELLKKIKAKKVKPFDRFRTHTPINNAVLECYEEVQRFFEEKSK